MRYGYFNGSRGLSLVTQWHQTLKGDNGMDKVTRIFNADNLCRCQGVATSVSEVIYTSPLKVNITFGPDVFTCLTMAEVRGGWGRRIKSKPGQKLWGGKLCLFEKTWDLTPIEIPIFLPPLLSISWVSPQVLLYSCLQREDIYLHSYIS